MKKSLLLCPYFVNKTPILQKHTVLMAIFCQKTSILYNTRCSHIICFQICHEKPPAVVPIGGQKNVNYVKTKTKKVHSMSFFPIFQEKTTALIPILKKTFSL